MDDDARALYEPESVTHPGETVVDYLESSGWSQRDLARRTGLTPKTVSEICNSKAPITPPTALVLEKVLQRPAHFWLNLQRRYDEAQARRRSVAKMTEWEQWASRFPLSEMKRYKWIEAKTHSRTAVNQLLGFFGVSSPQSWQSVWEASRVAYRQTRKFQTSVEAISAWTRATELLALQMDLQDFDEDLLLSLVTELRLQTKEPAEKFVGAVQGICARAGVAVVWVPELSHTGISGCARWLTDRKALIGLTLRYKYDDQMWFTFFHELAHILLHKNEHGFILDNADKDLVDKIVDPKMQKNEEEANRFAAETLIPAEYLSHFIKDGSFSNESIHEFAKQMGIGPGIVVGRLQREGLLGYHQGNVLKRKFSWSFDDV